MTSQASQHAETLTDLIDGQGDELGELLAPVRDFLKSLATVTVVTRFNYATANTEVALVAGQLTAEQRHAWEDAHGDDSELHFHETHAHPNDTDPKAVDLADVAGP